MQTGGSSLWNQQDQQASEEEQKSLRGDGSGTRLRAPPDTSPSHFSAQLLTVLPGLVMAET